MKGEMERGNEQMREENRREKERERGSVDGRGVEL